MKECYLNVYEAVLNSCCNLCKKQPASCELCYTDDKDQDRAIEVCRDCGNAAMDAEFS